MENFFSDLKNTDPRAVEAINAAKSEEELLEVLRSYGADVSTMDELIELAASEEALSDEDLEELAGGMGYGFCLWGGGGVGPCATLANRTQAESQCYTMGI